ncbi:MAG TPA: hypothetical protein DGT21_04055 [Armatimonadetes bacterium]|jgi:formamidopyrimidine-DNA glycosylase|nr:hypothetical protein [Armatimonadota bacterium]
MALSYPECVCLREQMEEALVGKQIESIWVLDITQVEGSWRFGAINQPPAVFDLRLRGATICAAESVASSVFLPTDTNHSLVLGYISGRALYHQPGEGPPERSCLRVCFTDESHLSVAISLWGLIRVLDDAERRRYVEKWYGRGIEPLSDAYTWEGFRDAAAAIDDRGLSAKKFLHAFEPGYYLSGLDAGYAIEVLHRACIHPKRALVSLSTDELRACCECVNTVCEEAVARGGRYSDGDLYGRPGGFIPRACEATLGTPCLECGTPLVKIKFEGGTSYLCPTCQPAP